VPDKPEVVLVKMREIKYKIDRRTSAKDRSNNIVSTKDIVRVFEGAYKVCTFSHVILYSDYSCSYVYLFCGVSLIIFLFEADKHLS
jgi:hypothetical protein